ncbi:MAG: FAD-dependent oxidoreductase [Gaiellales bacterium]
MRPYWLAEDETPVASTPLSAPAEVEIVGGGITGAACAHALATAGVRVRLHEAREIAGGASGRNGGFALRGMAAPYDVMAGSIGNDNSKALWEWTEREIVALRALAGDAFRQLGSLRIAVDGEERDELRAEYEAMVADGIDAEWVDRPVGPSPGRFTAGLLHPPDGALQPARLVRRLASLAAEAGAEICEHHRVGSVEELEAPTVIVCTDGYPSGLLGSIEGLIVPTRGQVIATEPIAEDLGCTMPHYGRHGFDYWHQAEDGRLVAGGFRDISLDSEFTDQESLTDTVQEALTAFVRELAGRDVRIDYRWAGIFGLVLDFLPVVGRLPGDDRVWVAGGYSGHGNVLGFSCGRLVARAVQGESDPLLALFAPTRLLHA